MGNDPRSFAAFDSPLDFGMTPRQTISDWYQIYRIKSISDLPPETPSRGFLSARKKSNASHVVSSLYFSRFLSSRVQSYMSELKKSELPSLSTSTASTSTHHLDARVSRVRIDDRRGRQRGG